jgi:hypothetical protein
MELKELRLQVIIDPKLPSVSESCVSFETGGTPEDRPKWSYSHSQGTPGALSLFFEDLILGAPFPLTLGIHRIGGADTVFAVALFMNRDLALHPSMPGLVASVDLYHRYGAPALAHLASDLGRFLRLVEGYFQPFLPREEAGRRLSEAVTWVREYVLEEKLPHIRGEAGEVRVIDVGTNGFVVGECRKPSYETWVEAYRLGFLSGVLFGPEEGGYRNVLVSKKSGFVSLDLSRALRFLNELEARGEPSEWQLEGFFLRPSDIGTTLLPSMVLEVLQRC